MLFEPAFAATPRHLFTPRVVDDDGAILRTGQDRWLHAGYSDTTLLTQTAPVDDSGQQWPTSSSSQPAVMAVMLERLAIHLGHRVLEIGTGYRRSDTFAGQVVSVLSCRDSAFELNYANPDLLWSALSSQS